MLVPCRRRRRLLVSALSGPERQPRRRRSEKPLAPRQQLDPSSPAAALDPAGPGHLAMGDRPEQRPRRDDERVRVVGYWVTHKKRVKFDWAECERICLAEGLILKPINIEADLEPQGPIDVFFHKLTNIMSRATDGDQHAKSIISRVKDYIFKHPELVVIDRLENLEILRNRYESYKMILEGFQHHDTVFIPNFANIQSKDTSEIKDVLEKNNIRFPFVCKPLIAQGSSDAHKLMVIFNDRGLLDCQPPCVAQNMISHSAILYKLFIVDDYFQIVERPSIKNFYPKDCETMDTIFFKSHDVCKKDSNSKWSVISAEEKALAVKPRHEVFVEIVSKVKKIFGLLLVGVDVVIDNSTGKYAIIDINAFPGYDGYRNFFEHLIVTIKKQMKEKTTPKRYPVLKKCLSDDLDSGFESDEKRKLFKT